MFTYFLKVACFRGQPLVLILRTEETEGILAKCFPTTSAKLS